MSCDRQTGTVWIGDVGDWGTESREEISLVVKGGNCQWPYREGTHERLPKPERLIGSEQPPLYEYRRGNGNRCVIGGHVYRGAEHAAELGGKYIFGDNGSGRIRSLEFEGVSQPVIRELCTLPQRARNDDGLSSFGMDNSGEIYLCLLGSPDRPTGDRSSSPPAPMGSSAT